MGLEGARRCAAGDLLHHGRFDFEIAARVEELAHGLEHFGPLDEDFAGVEVGEEIDVALAIAEFDVGEAVIFFRQGEHGLGEKGEPLDMDGELAGAGAEEIAGDADVVAEVEEFVEREALFADGVEADVNLQTLATLLERGESRFALGADGHDAAGDGDRSAIGFEIFGGGRVPLDADLGNGVRGSELVGIGCLAQLFDFG